MSTVAIRGLHHVQLAIPAGGEDEARAFYADILGLEEVAKPTPLQSRGGVWFVGTGVSLHLGVEDPFVPAKKAHPAFVVQNLLAAHKDLSAYGATEISALPGLRRFYIADPFGNRIEILETNDTPFAD